MANVYTVAAGERTLMHVEADSMAEARRAALADVKVTKLSTSEALAINNRGIAIVSAKTGKVCNAPANIENPQGPNGGGGRTFVNSPSPDAE